MHPSTLRCSHPCPLHLLGAFAVALHAAFSVAVLASFAKAVTTHEPAAVLADVAGDADVRFFAARLLHAHVLLHLAVNRIRHLDAGPVVELHGCLARLRLAVLAGKLLGLLFTGFAVEFGTAVLTLLPMLGLVAVIDVLAFANRLAVVGRNLFGDPRHLPFVPDFRNGNVLVVDGTLVDLLVPGHTILDRAALDTPLVAAILAGLRAVLVHGSPFQKVCQLQPSQITCHQGPRKGRQEQHDHHKEHPRQGEFSHWVNSLESGDGDLGPAHLPGFGVRLEPFGSRNLS